MFRHLAIAVSSIAAIATLSAGQAAAKVHINGYVNVGVPGVIVDPYPAYPVYPAYSSSYDDGYGEECGYRIVKKKVWNWKHTSYKVVTKKVLVCD